MLPVSCYILSFFIAVIFASAVKKPLENIQETTTEGFSIIGGEPADIKEVPYQVSLHYDQHFICGGSIIAPDIILTAGHCVYRLHNQPERFQIRAGSNLRNKGGSLKNVTKILMHPDYHMPISADKDVALMWLAENLKFDDTIKPVSLAKSGAELPHGSDILVSGWGVQVLLQRSQDILQKLTVQAVDAVTCKKIYEDLQSPIFQVTDNMMCAGVVGKSVCNGDSGGALVRDNVQYGIASWVGSCRDPKYYPSVYSKVAALRDWIDKTITEENKPTK